MNCLTYLIDLLRRGHQFKILYNGDHCIGVNEKKIFELGNYFKKNLIEGNTLLKYDKIENYQSLEVINKIFELKEEDKEVLEKYYNDNK